MYRFVGRELKPLERHTNESSQGEIGRVELGKERNLSRFYKSLATVLDQIFFLDDGSMMKLMAGNNVGQGSYG